MTGLKSVLGQCKDFLLDHSMDHISASTLEEFIDGIDLTQMLPQYEVSIIGPEGALLSFTVDGAWTSSVYSGSPLPVGQQLVIKRVK